MHEIEWTNERIEKLWSYYASNSAYRNQYFSAHSGEYILNYAKQYVNFKNKNILDFGCGPGYLIQKLINIARGKVYGLDFSKESIEQVNRKFTLNNNFAGAITVEKLPSSFSNSSMDLVTCVEVVEHLSDEYLSGALGEIYRVLKLGGYVVVTTKNQEDLEIDKTICPECGCIFHRWQHLRAWSVDSLKKTMEGNGFSTKHVSSTVFGSFPKRVYYFLNKLRNKEFIYPHLIYIGRK